MWRIKLGYVSVQVWAETDIVRRVDLMIEKEKV